jgi:signal recognition particle subunit SEC65
MGKRNRVRKRGKRVRKIPKETAVKSPEQIAIEVLMEHFRKTYQPIFEREWANSIDWAKRIGRYTGPEPKPLKKRY